MWDLLPNYLKFELDDYVLKQIEHDDTKSFNLLKKKIKKEKYFGCCLYKKLSSNEKIICYMDKKTSDIASFIWFEVYSSDKINSNSVDRISHINFSYTFEKFRKIGLNNKLREWVEKYSQINKINYIISVPLPGSYSENILKKLNYVKKDTYYIKKIF